MATSTSELKSRLRNFLTDPRANEEFRPWFASLLIGPNAPDVEALVHAIHLAFSDAAEGMYSPDELRAQLADLAKEEKAVNRMIVIQSSVLLPTVNHLLVAEKTAFPASPVSSGTSRGGVFSSAQPLPA